VTRTLGDIDLLEDTWARSVPYDQFDLLRREAPVYWHEHPAAQGFWAVTRYDDVRAISRDHETFSAELGSTFITDQEPETLEMIRMTILNMDPPKHSRYRRLVSAFVTEVAAELPLQMICEMIGVPDEDRHRIFDWSNRLIGFQDEELRTSEEDGQIAAAEIYAFCEAIAADRRQNGRDDIMTALVTAEVDGDRLRQDEINMFFVTLAVAGNETTRNLIAHSLQVLLERPEIKADLVANIDDDALWSSATEEFLRWGSSIHNFRRTATRDTEIAGQPIKAGDKVVIFYTSANRDPAHFEDPSVFDPRRSPNEHLTFGGGGAHFCLGANLARAQIKVMMREFLRRFPNVEASGEHRRMRSDFVNGIKYLPVRLNG
jgi:cholest-4-en-3-one 26-monooxygenase